MALIKSISGIRGTIGGGPGAGLTPFDIVKFTAAYGAWLQRGRAGEPLSVVVGRDARRSGDMLSRLVSGTLIGLGIHVIDLGLSTTPTVAVNVGLLQAQGGIVLTASHNPSGWNALKLLDGSGECVSGSAGRQILDFAERGGHHFAQASQLGRVTHDDKAIERHVECVLGLALVRPPIVRAAGLTAVLDAVNSTGGLAVPPLLHALGVRVIPLHCEPDGHFAHNPEPLPEHLGDIAQRVRETGADMGIAVDPDVDRLVFISEDGTPFGEEYTLVAVADYVLQHERGKAVSNLSSSAALRDVTRRHGQEYVPAAVGEVNVVAAMKAVRAVIGGEGNGGVIYPQAHYGRDALVGMALFLTHLAERGQSLSQLRATYPAYHMTKGKLPLTPGLDVRSLLQAVQAAFQGEAITAIDGVRIDFEDGWVHLRQSNTEPVLRLYAESHSPAAAARLADDVADEVSRLLDTMPIKP